MMKASRKKSLFDALSRDGVLLAEELSQRLKRLHPGFSARLDDDDYPGDEFYDEEVNIYVRIRLAFSDADPHSMAHFRQRAAHIPADAFVLSDVSDDEDQNAVSLIALYSESISKIDFLEFAEGDAKKLLAHVTGSSRSSSQEKLRA